MKWTTNVGVVCALIASSAMALPKPRPAAKASIDQAKFEALYRAGKSIEVVASDGGATQAKLAELMQTFTLELSIAKDKAGSGAEKELVQAYSSAHAGYADSIQLSQDRLKFERLLGGDAPCAGECEEHYIKKYEITGLPLHQEGGSQAHFHSRDVVDRLWAISGSRLSRATKLYLGT